MNGEAGPWLGEGEATQYDPELSQALQFPWRSRERRGLPTTFMIPTPHLQKGLSEAELMRGSQAGTVLEVRHL